MRLIFFVVLIAVAIRAIAGMASVAINTPIVEMSYSTGECVHVYDPARRYSCGEMPSRYQLAWVR